jgi:hypothetical protein
MCDLLQGMFVGTSFYTSATSVGLAVGSIMNQKWVQDMEVLVGHFCTIQGDLCSHFHCEASAELGAGAVKQASDVGSAIFTLVSACSLFQSRMYPLIPNPDPCSTHILRTLLTMADKALCLVADSSVRLVRRDGHHNCWPCGTRHHHKGPFLYVPIFDIKFLIVTLCLIPTVGISGYWCWITEPYTAEHITYVINQFVGWFR